VFKVRHVVLLLLLMAFAISLPAFADSTIYFNGNTQSSFNGVGTGIYGGTLNGNTANFLCDDYPDHITSGESWQAHNYDLENLSGVLFPTPHGQSTLAAYSEVAWLAENLFNGADNGGNNDPSTVSWAIWTILDSPGPGPSGTAALVLAAEAWWASLSASCQANPVACGAVNDINIWTPTSWNPADLRPQEFLTAVPEPATISLLLSGILGVGVRLRKTCFGRS
jgi:PEP-CTERM motif